MFSRLILAVTILGLMVAFGSGTAFGQFVVDAHSPERNDINVSGSTEIVVDFNMEVYTPSVGDTTFIAYGSSTGRHFGAITFANSNYTAILDPDEDFAPGEIVTVIVKHSIRASLGPDFLLGKSYVWTFTIKAASGLGTILTRTDYPLPDIDIPYGIAPGDYDGDDDIDIAACGWGSMLSILINGGAGLFLPGVSQNIIGTLPHDIVASDMNMDGFIDLSSANQWNDSVAVMVNNDNATFFLRDQQFPVDETAELAENLSDTFAQLCRLQEIAAHLLVVAERGAAMHQRIVIPLRQTLGAGRDVRLVEIAQKYSSQAFQISDAGTMIVPCSARSLIRLIKILDVHAVHQPQQRCGITGNVAALPARLVMPETTCWNLLVPAIQRLHHRRLVFFGDAVNDNLAVFLELPHDVANVFDPLLVGKHGTAIDLLLNP